jgi:hypothetical protein
MPIRLDNKKANKPAHILLQNFPAALKDSTHIEVGAAITHVSTDKADVNER